LRDFITTRTQEIGICIAVGARNGDIFLLMLVESLKLSLTGLALGLLGAISLGRTGSTLLFGVTPGDPLTFIVLSLLLGVAMATC